MWSDSYRYRSHSVDEPTIFPKPENYDNLDFYLYDIRQAINDEKVFRRKHHLNSLSARIDYHIERQFEPYFDVI